MQNVIMAPLSVLNLVKPPDSTFLMVAQLSSSPTPSLLKRISSFQLPYISQWKWDPLSLPADLLNIPIPINHAITNLSLSVSELANSNDLALQN